MKILFVEDDSRSLVFAEVMIQQGYDVLAVDNLKDAARELERGEYGAVILDLAMSGLDLPKEYHNDVIELGHHAGSIFHDKIMRKRFPQLLNKTVILTGVSDVAKSTRPGWYAEYNSKVVRKVELDYKERVFNFLDSFKVA